MTDRATITVNQLRVDDGMDGGRRGGAESEGWERGRGAIYLDLKGEAGGRGWGVGEDTEDKDKWALMVGLWA